VGPLQQCFGVNARPDVGAGKGEMLQKIEPGRQLVDRLLAGTYGVGRGRRQQPTGKRLLAGARSCDREQFEQRAAAEEVEVVCIQVVVVLEAITWFTGADPAVL